ncbi:hypothetical protein F2Q70_00018148 [Brassica cretica]|uniref:Uncharacterized protein n=1 Tax=Brassica cretica TaxID=69181 RepID=A0A3N6QM44_BRACR|nr:hypothetical protein F2Q70_00018148 [Brassica cretica]
MPTSVNDTTPRPHMMKSQENFHTREEIDQLVEGIYRALETTEERLDGRCDDIYFPMLDLNIIALTSKIEAIQGNWWRFRVTLPVDQKHRHRSTDAITNQPTFIIKYWSTTLQTEAG